MSHFVLVFRFYPEFIRVPKPLGSLNPRCDFYAEVITVRSVTLRKQTIELQVHYSGGIRKLYAFAF